MFGVTLAALVVALPTNYFNLRVFDSEYGIKTRRITVESLRALLLSIGWLAVVYFLRGAEHYIATWPRFIFELSLVGCASAAYCWFVVLRLEDRNNWTGRIRRPFGLV